jgi:hypothetical protein
MRRCRAVLASILPALIGCGYVGDPLPPALNIPERITDLKALQRGGEILVQFTPALRSTDQLMLKSLQEFELRAGPQGEGQFDVWRWAAGAERFSIPFRNAEPVQHRLASGAWVGREIVIAVRGIGPTGRGGEWSDLAVLTVTPALPRASGFAARGVPKGVYLTWKESPLPEGASWRIWRSSEGGETEMLGFARDPSWLDTAAVPGRQYSYWVQAAYREGGNPAEGEPGDILNVAYRDEFAPEPPKGLTAIAGLGAVELAWERNTESDLAGYYVFRGLEDGPLTRLGETVAMPAASDPTAEPGKRYRYAVASVDSAGNASQPCEAVEVVAAAKP